MRVVLVTCVAAGMAWLCGCAAPAGKADAPSAAAAKPAGEVLAKIGDTVITEKDLDDKIGVMPPRIAGRFRSPAARKSLLNSIVELEVIFRDAKKQGFDNDRQTLDRLEEYRKRLAAERLREKVMESVKADEDEVLEEYEKGGDRYKVQKQVKVSQILFTWDSGAPSTTAESVKGDAAGILERARKGEDFAELARKYSLDQASAAKGGDIGYATRRSLSPEAYKVAMAMEKEGEVSGLIEGKGEVRILKATEVIPEKKKPLEEVRPWLERVVQSRKQREAWMHYLDELKKREGVEIFEERLGGSEQPQRAPGKMEINLGGPKSPGMSSGWVTSPGGAEKSVAPAVPPPRAN